MSLLFIIPLQGQRYDNNALFYQGTNYVDSISASACDSNEIIGFNAFSQRRVFGLAGYRFDQDTLETFARCDSMFPYLLTRAMLAMSDAGGNLIFHTNGLRIIDTSGHTMLNGDSLNPGQYADLYPSFYAAYNTLLCLASPGETSVYYLLHQVIDYDSLGIDSTVYTTALYYTKIDMNLNGGLGGVVEKNVPIPIPASKLGVSNLMACKHANGRDWWVIQPGLRNGCYHSVLLDSTGLHYVQVQCFPEQDTFYDISGQAIFSPNGELYARYTATIGVKLYDFDRCSGLLTNQRVIDGIEGEINIGIGIGGVCFSPSSKYLYVTNMANIYQYSIDNPDVIDIKNSRVEIDTLLGVWSTVHPLYGTIPFVEGIGWMQLAPDGSIIIAPAASALWLKRILSPDNPGQACQFERFSVPLLTWTGLTIPLYPHYRLGALTGSICDTLGLSSLQSTSYWLDFGQVEAGSSATLGIDVVSRVGYPASLDTLQYRQATGVFSSSLALPTMLPKYDTLHYDVSFSPTSAGYVEDTLELHSNYGVVRVRLTGNGISSVGTVASQPVSVQLYPNPANNAVTVYAQGAEIAQALLYSSRGELLKTQSIAQSKGQLDLAGLPPGLYLVELVLADGRRGVSKLLVINY
jgi:hypothetical protein